MACAMSRCCWASWRPRAIASPGCRAKQTDADYAATKAAMAEGFVFIHQASVVGTISTLQGDVEFVCAGVAVTGSSRGICGLR